MSFFRFRVEDRNLSTFTAEEKKQIKKFQTYIMKKPDGHCCFCLKLLYPDQQLYRKIENPTSLPCIEWNIQPIKKSKNGVDLFMVCKVHKKKAEDNIIRYVYPG